MVDDAAGEYARWEAHYAAEVAKGVCPYSGRTIRACQESDLCDCFDFEEQAGGNGQVSEPSYKAYLRLARNAAELATWAGWMDLPGAQTEIRQFRGVLLDNAKTVLERRRQDILASRSRYGIHELWALHELGYLTSDEAERLTKTQPADEREEG